MNIDTVGRIRPPRPGEVQSGLQITDGKRVHAQQGGASHSFQILYQADATNQELFTNTVQPLLDLFLAGFNTCVLVYGESGSGKTFTTIGEQSGGGQAGIVPQAVSYVTTNLQQQNSQLPDTSFVNSETSPRQDERGRLLMYQFDIYNELIRDMLAARGSLSGRPNVGPMELEYSAERGMFVKNLHYEVCKNPTDAITALWQGWLTRNTSTTDFGPASNYTSHVFQLELYMMTEENPLPNRSTFTVIRLPGAEKLAEDLSRTRVREGPSLSKSMVTFNKLTADLARQPDAKRVVNYSDSKLTSLLDNILGGNCKTRVICCLSPSNNRPDTLGAILTGCGLLSQVKNFPIINDCLAQDLLTQFRTKLDTSLQLGGADSGAGAGLMSRPELQDQLMKITSDNTQLRERNDRLFQRLEQSQEKMTEMAKSKSELSSKLVASEEEKLKVSKGLVELQLENNRLTEEYESENFELKNKVLTLENQLVEFELEKNKFARTYDISAEHSRQLEENRKMIADEFVDLKKKTVSLEEQLAIQVKKNEEMRLELARLIETEAALLNLRDNVDRQRQVHDEATEELARARIVLRDAKITATVSNDDALDKLKARRAELQREMLDGSSMRSTSGGKDVVVTRMKQVYDQQTQKLEGRLAELKAQLAAAYAGIQSTSNKHAEQTTMLVSSQENVERLSDENSNLQQQLKEANEDYRRRLWKYVQDIAAFVDNGPSTGSNKQNAPQNQAMKDYADGMMKDMRSAFRSREDQLISAARKYKKQSKRVAQRHEKLLIHYRILRDQLELLRSMSTEQSDNYGDVGSPLSHFPPIDLGPDPSVIVVTENDLASENTLELNKLRSLLAKAKAEAERAKGDMKRQKHLDKTLKPLRTHGQSYDQGNRNVDYSPRDFHINAQLERERADLLTRVTVAEQQLREQQEYIDTHLARYKQEIIRMRRILSDKGIRIDERPLSPDYSPRRKLLGRQTYGL